MPGLWRPLPRAASWPDLKRERRMSEPTQNTGVLRQLGDRLTAEVRKVVVGQDHLVEAILAAIAVNGHVLLEGVPGTAKTLLANAVSRALGVEFRRVQFTPDMLP